MNREANCLNKQADRSGCETATSDKKETRRLANIWPYNFTA